MKSFATSICPIKKSSRSEYEASPRHPRAIPAPYHHHPRAIPPPSPRHPRAILAPSPRGETITQPISKRFLSGVITGLRHGDLAYMCFRAISAWRSSHLSALRHGDPVYRHLRAISTWQSVLLTGLWNGHLAHRCLSGLLADPL